jgi:hypothetical protein
MKSNQVTQLDDNWHRPTLDDCKNAAFKIGLTDADAEKFFEFYEARGWLIKGGVRVEKPEYQMKYLKNQTDFFSTFKSAKQVRMDRCYQCGGNIGDNGMVRMKMLILENLPWCRMHCYELWKKKGRPEK